MRKKGIEQKNRRVPSSCPMGFTCQKVLPKLVLQTSHPGTFLASMGQISSSIAVATSVMQLKSLEHPLLPHPENALLPSEPLG